MDDNLMDLKKKITAVHMMLIELKLYLNTHPCDRTALAKHNYYIEQYQALVNEYTRQGGMISPHNSQSSYPWQWIEEPWPWEYEANFKL